MEIRFISFLIKSYFINNFQYDFIKDVTASVISEADIEFSWERKMGTELDLSAIVCAMLRSQGIPAILLMGKDDHPSAWVLVMLEDRVQVFNPAVELRAKKTSDLGVVRDVFSLLFIDYVLY